MTMKGLDEYMAKLEGIIRRVEEYKKTKDTAGLATLLGVNLDTAMRNTPITDNRERAQAAANGDKNAMELIHQGKILEGTMSRDLEDVWNKS